VTPIESEECDKVCVSPRRGPTESDVLANTSFINIEYPSTHYAEAAAVVLYAYTLLRDNWDIIRWIVCTYAGGNDSKLLGSCKGVGGAEWVDCLRDAVLNEVLTVKLGGADALEYCDVGARMGWSGASAGAFIGVDGGHVEACPDSAWWVDLRRALSGRKFPCATGDTVLCVAVDVAAHLLHELLHGCGFMHWDGTSSTSDSSVWPNHDCTFISDAFNSHLYDICVVNTFRWAMARRYPAIQRGCCSRFIYALNVADREYALTESPCSASYYDQCCDEVPSVGTPDVQTEGGL